MLTEQNVPEHYNPNTNNLYDGQHNIPLYKKIDFSSKKKFQKIILNFWKNFEKKIYFWKQNFFGSFSGIVLFSGHI